MRRERIARGWTTHDVVRELSKRNVSITEPSYRGYEAGPRVSAPVKNALEAVFGSKAPDTKKEAAEPVGLDSLVGAIYAQTAAINELVKALRAMHLGDLPSVVADELANELEQEPQPDGEDAPSGSGGSPDGAGTARPLTT